MKKAIVLLSGGIDSAVTVAIAIREGYELYCLSFDYGQPSIFELDAAKTLAKTLKVKQHKIVKIVGREIWDSSLDDTEYRKEQGYYVPARNTLFLSYALAWAEEVGSSDIFIGVIKSWGEPLPDTRLVYIRAFEVMSNLATKSSNYINIHTPLIKKKKAEVIQEGIKLGVNMALTLSCHNISYEGISCGKCSACISRLDSFKTLGIEDRILYKN